MQDWSKLAYYLYVIRLVVRYMWDLCLLAFSQYTKPSLLGTYISVRS
jgi:hypothetical protein